MYVKVLLLLEILFIINTPLVYKVAEICGGILFTRNKEVFYII